MCICCLLVCAVCVVFVNCSMMLFVCVLLRVNGVCMSLFVCVCWLVVTCCLCYVFVFVVHVVVCWCVLLLVV